MMIFGMDASITSTCADTLAGASFSLCGDQSRRTGFIFGRRKSMPNRHQYSSDVVRSMEAFRIAQRRYDYNSYMTAAEVAAYMRIDDLDYLQDLLTHNKISVAAQDGQTVFRFADVDKLKEKIEREKYV